MNPRYSNVFLVVAFILATAAALLVNSHETKNFAGEAFRASAFTSPTSYERDTYQSEPTYEEPALPTDLEGLTKVLRTQSTSDLEEAAIKRKEQLTELAKENPQEYLSHTLSSYERSRLPSGVREHVEQEQELEGTIVPLVIEKEDTAEYEYMLDMGDDAIYLRNTNLTPEDAGAQIKVRGVGVNDEYVAKVPAQFVSGTPEIDEYSQGTHIREAIIVPITYADTTTNGVTKEDIRVMAQKVADYYKEASYGRTTFNFRVDDWEHLRAFQPEDCDFSGLRNWINRFEFKQLKYQYVVYLISRDCDHGLSGIGTLGRLKGIGWSNVFFESKEQITGDAGSTNPLSWKGETLAHELGHNLGLHHASGLDCGSNVKEGACKEGEYMNYYALMGYGTFAHHISAYNKERLGWLSDGNIQTITEPGTYTLRPFEQEQGVRAAKIPLRGDGAYYLEYRQPIGYDTIIDDHSEYWLYRYWDAGVKKRSQGLKVTWKPSGEKRSYVLDMSPEHYDGIDWRLSFLYPPGGPSIEQYYDEKNRVAIGPITRQSDSSISFKVTYAADVDLELIEKTGGAMITWRVDKDDARCTASGAWTGTKPQTGMIQVQKKSYPQDFTLTCTYAGLTTRDRVTLDGY